MKKTIMKRGLIAGVGAIVTGSLLFGLTGAFADPVPGNNPDDGNGIAPTFTGVNLTGTDDGSGVMVSKIQSLDDATIIDAPHAVILETGDEANGDKASIMLTTYDTPGEGDVVVESTDISLESEKNVGISARTDSNNGTGIEMTTQSINISSTYKGATTPDIVYDADTGEISTNTLDVKGNLYNSDATVNGGKVVIDDADGVQLGSDADNISINNNIITGYGSNPLTITTDNANQPVNIVGSSVDVTTPTSGRINLGKLIISSEDNTSPDEPGLTSTYGSILIKNNDLKIGTVADGDGLLISEDGDISDTGGAVIIQDADGIELRDTVIFPGDFKINTSNPSDDVYQLTINDKNDIDLMQFTSVLLNTSPPQAATTTDINSNEIHLEGDTIIRGRLSGGESGDPLEIIDYDGVKIGLSGLFISPDGYISDTNDKVVINDPLHVAGKITAAGGIGTYYTKDSGATTLGVNTTDRTLNPSSGTYGTASISCDEDDIAIACNARTYSNNTTINSSISAFASIQGTFLADTNDDNINDKCYVTGLNSGASTRYLRAQVVCFNPEG